MTRNDAPQAGRRALLKSTGGALLAPAAATAARAVQPAVQPALRGRWIWYPGQLAAYRHARLIRLATERCVHVGYPANFRQPVPAAYFRKRGRAAANIAANWTGPVGRIRVWLGSTGLDITQRDGTFKAGATDIIVHIDFAQSLPCLFMEADEFSTGDGWEASLDGNHWVPAEVSDSGDFATLPDAAQERVVKLPLAAAFPAEHYQGGGIALSDAQDVVLDFREIELGTLRFTARGEGELTVQVGESVPEVRDPDPKFFEQIALQPVALTAQPASIALPERALRYARLEVKGNVQLSDIHFDAKVNPAPALGRFETSDTALNAIWNVAVATLRSNMHDFYLDGIRRDGLVWHDGTQALEAFERVFFQADMSRQTLIAQTLPEQPSVRDFGIIDSQMYDVIGFEREYMMRGDARFSRMFRDRIEDSLELYTSLQDGSALLDAKRVKPYGYFPDWSASKATGPDAKGAPAYGQMLLAGAFTAGARLAGAWGDEKLRARWSDAAARIRATVRREFLEPHSGLYINGIDSAGQRDRRITSFAQAFAIAFDVARPAEMDDLFACLNDPARRAQRWSLSQVVELTAYAKAGRTSDGISRLKSVWLPMIERGYRRFFEDIRPAQSNEAQLAMYSRKYGNSLCHAWAGAAPVMLLSRGVLGIEPLEPGFSLCQVTPMPSGIASGYGAVPTPRGLIEVEWSAGKGEVVLPAETKARLPNGQVVTGKGRHSIPIVAVQ
jgi:hypothetical protein